MNIAQNIRTVQQEIAQACDRAGRDPSDVVLIAVSKTQPVSALLEAAAAGVQHFGENRVEEANIKIPQVQAQLSRPVTWHMIGHIQSRKARDVPQMFQVVHSIDRLKLAERLSQVALNMGQTLEVLLEVNISGEATKAGLTAFGWQQDSVVRAALWAEVSAIAALPALRVSGLMTMAPIVDDMAQTRPFFGELAMLRQALSAEHDLHLPHLSMGMTNDYPVAVEEGATMVRVGRAIFGPRKQ